MDWVLSLNDKDIGKLKIKIFIEQDQEEKKNLQTQYTWGGGDMIRSFFKEIAYKSRHEKQERII